MTKLTLERHELIVLQEMVQERYEKLVQILSKNNSPLDEYEKDITNYTTYDLHKKLLEVTCQMKM